MELFTHRSFLQKIIIAIVCITLFNFITPNYMMLVSNAAETEESTEADDEGGWFADAGGILLSPFVAFINFFADTIASAVQSFMMNNAEAVMTPSVDNYAKTTSKDADVIITKDYNGALYPNFTFSCEEIFANKVPMLDINFLNPSVKSLGEDKVDKDDNIAAQLQNIIKAWYRVLRMIAIVGLLSVLIYTGIRIMIDSNASNKAKYKERLLDWLVALIIVFSMQYIMSFTLTMSQELTNLFTGENEETRNIIVKYGDNTYFKTNLIGLTRFKVQNDNLFSKVSYEIVYIALLFFTVKFTITYLKRVIYMAFLTLISPIVALMYPIQDGKSQAFGMWLKEYIFNALIQPLHYLLYTILISSAISLAANNPIYAIVALLFMTKAEKFLKDLFGFGKAKGGTMESSTSHFTAAAVGSGMVSLMKNGASKLGNANSELSKRRLPVMKKDTDIDGLSGGVMPTENLSSAEGQNVQSQPVEEPSIQAQQMEEVPPQAEQVEESPMQSQSVEEPLVQNQPIEENTPMDRAQSRNLVDSISSPNNATSQRGVMKKKIANKAKTIGKSIYDTDKSLGYNTKRFLKRAGKVYLGAGMGITTAAAEIGASVVDGKFNPAEAVAAATVGATAGGALFDYVGNKHKQSKYGTDQAAAMDYMNKWNKNKEVNEFYKDNYKEDSEYYKQLTMEGLLPRGIKDLNEQKQCLKYADAVQDEKYTEWVENEKQVIKQEHSDYSEEQIQTEFNKRKQIQAEQIRAALGKKGKGLKDDDAIQKAIRTESVKEAATVAKFRKKADNKGALMDSDKKKAFIEQQVKALKAKPENKNKSTKELESYVHNAFNKVDRFDAVNDL